MLDTNQAVLRSLEAALLTPAAVEAIVHEVVASARPAEETVVPRRAALRADLAVVEAEITRLTGAIARAPISAACSTPSEPRGSGGRRFRRPSPRSTAWGACRCSTRSP
jgi:hypothetical protein